jgi:hypothetical protein
MASYNSLKSVKGQLDLQAGVTVASLPSPPSLGMVRIVTDATSPTVGSTVAGGGAAKAMCWYNGTAWKVMGV